ncbi:hypothetical protein LZK82_16770 [Rhizobium leguminosarum]|nr:hypothetical protein LZK82_16770 [Rhizobium leguminosarum]UIL26850.1 hypothetical protein LZK75_16895 [Rhizobium leguminosarum]
MRSKNLHDPATLEELLRADLIAGCLAQLKGKISREHYLRRSPYHAARSSEISEVFRRYDELLADLRRNGGRTGD